VLDAQHIPPLDPQEMTGRFVLSRKHINRQTGTLKADAFVPHPYEELSVMRLIQTTDEETLQIGRAVAAARTPPKTLWGRGDVLAATYITQRLTVTPDPVDGNPNHALVSGWPADDKVAQLEIAKEIAAVAKFVPAPLS
jgi:hypothetical protein